MPTLRSLQRILKSQYSILNPLKEGSHAAHHIQGLGLIIRSADLQKHELDDHSEAEDYQDSVQTHFSGFVQLRRQSRCLCFKLLGTETHGEPLACKRKYQLPARYRTHTQVS